MSLNQSIIHGKEHRKPYREAKGDLHRVIELTVLNAIHIIACLFMAFFWGMSKTENGEKSKTTKRIWHFFLAVAWICTLIK